MPGLGPSSLGITFYVPPGKRSSQWDVLSDIAGLGLLEASATSPLFFAACAIAASGVISSASASLTLGATAAITGFATVSAASGGIFQLGGLLGGDILYDDDLNADASLDAVAGSYHMEDLYQKSQANGWKAADGITAAIEKWGWIVLGLLARYWFHV